MQTATQLGLFGKLKDPKPHGPLVYCPKCDGYCGDVYFGVLYHFGKANLGNQCPHCKTDINKQVEEAVELSGF